MPGLLPRGARVAGSVSASVQCAAGGSTIRRRPAKLLHKLFSNIGPVQSLVTVRRGAREPLLEDLAVPLGHGNAFRVSSDPVPQRAHVVDPLVDRQVVESGRRVGQKAGASVGSW